MAVIIAVLLGVGVWVWASSASASKAGAPNGVLHQDTRMGVVDLTVSDLPLMRDFYEGAIGLDVLTESEDRVELGTDGSAVISLTVDAELTAAEPTSAGLYHSAILYPDEAGLAATLANVAQAAPASYQGSADHRVSLAFYFADPEGNGVELYVDRPADEWEWVDGRVTMGSEPLDPNQFIDDHLAPETSGSATVGHVHLRVGELDAAETFYVDVLGFDITAEVPGAVFLSAGGYHHHLAVNTWNSKDVSERMPALGLGNFTVVLADAAELEAASDRVADAGLETKAIDGGVAVDDPWGNTVHLLVG